MTRIKVSRGLVLKFVLTVIFATVSVLLKGHKLSVTVMVAQIADMVAYAMTEKTIKVD